MGVHFSRDRALGYLRGYFEAIRPSFRKENSSLGGKTITKQSAWLECIVKICYHI